MASDPTSRSDRQQNDDHNAVLQAIESFEGILEAFPEDVSALESLIVAYDESGNDPKVIEKSLQLADLMAQEGNWRRVETIAKSVLEKDTANQRAQILHDTARDSLSHEQPTEMRKTGRPTEDAPQPAGAISFDINAELELAWFLLNNEIITQEHYETAISGLTDGRTNTHSGASLSLLQELANIERVNLDRVIGALSAQTETPYIDVTQFDIPLEVAKLIPIDDARHLGVLPFAQLKDDIMVAV